VVLTWHDPLANQFFSSPSLLKFELEHWKKKIKSKIKRYIFNYQRSDSDSTLN